MEKQVNKVNAELENVLNIEDFIIEELPSLPLALEQGDPSYTTF
ncbi:hypothetical protein [Heyndrickxia sporothermodurans]|nr:hypothetical protein [Heyndrickxia sporothermodurans]MED3696808.1 hypothetical protein [Heyndrickxia sporothermodurans]MED3780650.1 hypothetical protein [Heyndrickxia sporothermodurans]